MMPPPSNVDAPSIAGNDPAMEGRPQQHTPLWMDVPQQPPQRTGVVRSPYATLSTIGFFLLITFAVAGAGLIGMALWGPDKTIKNRTALATEPPALPSLPASADAPASAPPVADSASAAPSSSARAASPAKKTKKKSPQRQRKSKGR